MSQEKRSFCFRVGSLEVRPCCCFAWEGTATGREEGACLSSVVRRLWSVCVVCRLSSVVCRVFVTAFASARFIVVCLASDRPVSQSWDLIGPAVIRTKSSRPAARRRQGRAACSARATRPLSRAWRPLRRVVSASARQANANAKVKGERRKRADLGKNCWRCWRNEARGRGGCEGGSLARGRLRPRNGAGRPRGRDGAPPLRRLLPLLPSSRRTQSATRKEHPSGFFFGPRQCRSPRRCCCQFRRPFQRPQRPFQRLRRKARHQGRPTRRSIRLRRSFLASSWCRSDARTRQCASRRSFLSRRSGLRPSRPEAGPRPRPRSRGAGFKGFRSKGQSRTGWIVE